MDFPDMFFKIYVCKTFLQYQTIMQNQNTGPMARTLSLSLFIHLLDLVGECVAAVVEMGGLVTQVLGNLFGLCGF